MFFISGKLGCQNPPGISIGYVVLRFIFGQNLEVRWWTFARFKRGYNLITYEIYKISKVKKKANLVFARHLPFKKILKCGFFSVWRCEKTLYKKFCVISFGDVDQILYCIFSELEFFRSYYKFPKKICLLNFFLKFSLILIKFLQNCLDMISIKKCTKISIFSAYIKSAN